MLSVKIEAINARQVEMAMAGFALEVTDMTTILPKAIPVLNSMVHESFSSEGTSGEHGDWAALSPRYAAWKERHYPGKTILQRTGLLFDSFDTGGPMHVERVSETTLEWGSEVPYAIYHQTGYRTNLGRQTAGGRFSRRVEKQFGVTRREHYAEYYGERMSEVPARRELDPTQENIDDIRRAIQAGIVQMARRRGFAIAGGVYGPAELQEVGPGEAFVLGKTSLSGNL